MEEREMRRKDKLVEDRAWMEQVLEEATYLELAMADEDGWPYIVPMGFAYEDGKIYIHGAAQGLKSDILAKNPRVCFQICLDAEVLPNEVGSEFSMAYRSLTGWGEVTTLTGLQEKNDALEVLMKHYKGPHTPLTEKNVSHVWVARLDIQHMAGKQSPPPKK